MSKIIKYKCDICGIETSKFRMTWYKRKHLKSIFSNKIYSKKFQICETCEKNMWMYLKEKINNEKRCQMDKKELIINNGIDIYDGYNVDTIWIMPENYSTYCSSEIDSQCTIPIQNL